MKHLSFVVASVLGVALIGEGPAMSVAPGLAPPPAMTAPSGLDRLTERLSTQSRSCVRRSKDCSFKPCCDGRTCRQIRGGENVCR